ncbi:YihY family inner membrane protein [Kineococcus xinjiangensis]|uniref:YihY family inner membrane protein n=1 Tax=Kineococcus xinjiangensis TaxID=512762 RepID=A0A2S6IKN2_9ACTN|nr:YhjD/YihY/BrkB family envelope integrity protein [Kineococcus xinjiangensis]PPK94735.1 YihY family inner membrane protein [Kineococcus xinjiangensis]
MSSVTQVPELARTGIGRLTPRDAWCTVRRHGAWPLLRETFTRFRYGDGFSHSRALGFQLTLAAIPLVIAAFGLITFVEFDALRVVLQRTILALVPGASQDLVVRTLDTFSSEKKVNVLALTLGLAAAVTALFTAMGQVQRGANRIYGVQRDEPALRKYTRAAVLAVLAGLPAMAGFVLLVTGAAFASAVEDVYGLDDDIVEAVAYPAGTVLLLTALTLVLRHGPCRKQPSHSLLVLGGAIAMAMWLGLTALLGAFLDLAAGIGTVYGPLTGFMALLLWSQLTSLAVFVAFALSAELEAAFVGQLDAATDDPSDHAHETDRGPRRRGEADT